MSKAKSLWVSSAPKHLLFWSVMLLMVLSFGKFTGVQAMQAPYSNDLIEIIQNKHQYEVIAAVNNGDWDLYGESSREEDEDESRKEEEETEQSHITGAASWGGLWKQLAVFVLFEEGVAEGSFIESTDLSALVSLPKYVLYSQFKFHLG